MGRGYRFWFRYLWQTVAVGAAAAAVMFLLTGVGIIVAYHRSRKKTGAGPICGAWGALPFQILVVAGTLLSTIGALLPVK